MVGAHGHFGNDVGAGLDAQGAGFQAQVVILGLAPVPAGVVLIVHFTALILLVEPVLGALFGLAVEPLPDSLGPKNISCPFLRRNQNRVYMLPD